MPVTPRRKPKTTKKISSRDKVRSHRERLRAQGLRPIQIWVPDTRAPRFAIEARRQCKRVAESPLEVEDQTFVDSISLLNDE
jgi:hypothetical protein